MKIERRIIFAELDPSKGYIRLPTQRIRFESGDEKGARAQIEKKKQALIKDRGTKVALLFLTTRKGNIVFANDDFELDLGSSRYCLFK